MYSIRLALLGDFYLAYPLNCTLYNHIVDCVPHSLNLSNFLFISWITRQLNIKQKNGLKNVYTNVCIPFRLLAHTLCATLRTAMRHSYTKFHKKIIIKLSMCLINIKKFIEKKEHRCVCICNFKEKRCQMDIIWTTVLT